MTMDAERAFKAALHHYRKGQRLLNIREIIPQEEQALHFARAGAHFGAGNLALGLARAQMELNVYEDDDDDDDDDDDEDEPGESTR
jgi:hypothetical protein